MTLDSTKPTLLKEAVSLLSGKTPVGSILRTAEWERMPLALRQRGQFSAGVESLRVMQRVQDALGDFISNARGEAEGRRISNSGTQEPGVFKMDRQKFVADLRQLAVQEGLAPQDDLVADTVRDITSKARLELIFNTQTQQARGFAFWKRGQQRNVLNAWPAQELIRVEDRKEPRNWARRWVEAGGEFRGGRMVALKTDSIWTAISRFDTPFPPFDFNSGMGLREIDREEAISLGLIETDRELSPDETEFNDDLEASVKGIKPELLGAYKTIFGDQIEVDGDSVKWRGN